VTRDNLEEKAGTQIKRTWKVIPESENTRLNLSWSKRVSHSRRAAPHEGQCVAACSHQVLFTQLPELLELLGDQQLSTSYGAPHLPEDCEQRAKSLEADRPPSPSVCPPGNVQRTFLNVFPEDSFGEIISFLRGKWQKGGSVFVCGSAS